MNASRLRPDPKPLILAGGKSTRMGSPKHLLQTPLEEPLYQHQIRLLNSMFPGATIYISLAQGSQRDGLLSGFPVIGSRIGHPNGNNLAGNSVAILLDQSPSDFDESSGPASGMLAAHAYDPQASWLVVACDYPFISAEGLQKLLEQPPAPVTCYRSEKGFCEPLLGLWSPEAMKCLAKRVAEGKLSPSAVVKEVGGEVLEAPTGCQSWFANVNTREDWENAKRQWKIMSPE